MATYYNPDASVVPYQMLPMSQKDKEWKEANVNAYIGKCYFGNNNDTNRKYEMKVAYGLYNSIFDEKDLKYVTDPYKVKDGFPANIQNFNIIKPKIDLLMGEETKRPFSFKVVQTNEEATSELQTKYKELLVGTLQAIATQGNPEDPITDKDMEKIEEINKYMERDYSDDAEMTAYHTLNYLMEKEEVKSKFTLGFHDLLCSSMEVYFTGQINGEPVLERVNPLYFSHDYSPEVRYIEDGDWAVRRMRMSVAAIYDRFYDLMSEAELKDLLDRFNYSGGRERQSMGEFKSIEWRNIPNTGMDDADSFTGNTIDVWHVVWKSLKKIGFVSYFDEEGEEQTDIVDETYEPTPEEDVKWDWVTEVWEGYRIGDNLFLGIRPIPEQAFSIDNPNSNKLPYVGMVFNNINTAPKSLVEIMKPLQYMYLVVWYRLELAIARDKGKVPIMDVTQIPKSMGVDVNKWLHYLSSLGVMLVNPYEDGWDIPGREGGKPAAFNQFSSLDLTMSNVISEYIGLMNKIEEMIGELSGITRQRQGQVQTSELVGNVQQTIVQSSHITEMLFFNHNQVKRRVLNNLLNIAKNVWANSNKKKLHYITNDINRVFMDISENFLYSDFDIFVTDSTKENQDIDMIKNLYQPAMQNGASLLEVATIMSSTNLTDIKQKLETIEKNKRRREDELSQQQQEGLMQAEQLRQQTEQSKMQLEQEKLRLQEDDSIRRAETAIQVALIAAERAANQSNGEDKSLDREKFNLQSTKEMADITLKSKQLNETIRHNQATESISKNKPKATTR